MMFHAKYLSSSSFGFLKEDILSYFFRLPWQPEFCLELNSEQFLKLTTKETFLWSLDEIGSAVYEEISFKVKVYGRTPDWRTQDEKRSQKLIMSLCDR
jgi:hypothetical protein